MSSYLDYWQLCRPPFRASGIYASAALAEAQARVEFLARNSTGVAALLGDAGSGKSVALRHMATTLRQPGRTLHTIDAVASGVRDALSAMAGCFGLASITADDTPRLWRRLADALASQSWQTRELLLLVDNAGDVAGDLLYALARVLHMAQGAGLGTTLVLAATPSQASRWPTAVRDRLELRIDMYAWDEEATCDYLQHALVEAGRTAPVFTEDALHALQVESHGVPGKLVRTAELSLVAGAAAGLPIVDSGCVLGVCRELTCALV
jgi:type II secretory pathway predicted ATPase ExeA